MSDAVEWEFPERYRPKPEALAFDLHSALASMLLLRAEVPEDAFTAEVLGTERVGNGVVIRSDGLVLTIGYLIEVIALSHGGLTHALNARVIARREFAGYWEYVLDEALFTAPAHPHWSGAALLSREGKLLAIGSLLVQEAIGGQRVDANMFVPVSLLDPILNDLTTLGRASRPTRPWLGMYTTELEGNLVVSGLADGGPADSAGVTLGDIVVDVAGERVDKLAELFRTIWRQGPAGTEVPLTLARGKKQVQVRVHSRDRGDFLRKPQQH